MFDEEALAKLQERMGYTFKDRSLLRAALTHRSYTNEVPGDIEDNERLEFLGDAVVNLSVAAEACRLAPEADEGGLTRLRAYVVCKDALADAARSLGLSSLLLLGKGASREERTGEGDRVLSCAFEAVAGAVFLDGGFEAADRFVLSYLGSMLHGCLDGDRPLTDAKSALQAACLRVFKKTPRYQVVAVEGPAHDPTFEVRVTLPDGTEFSGRGHSKKDAEQSAAESALLATGMECA